MGNNDAIKQGQVQTFMGQIRNTAKPDLRLSFNRPYTRKAALPLGPWPACCSHCLGPLSGRALWAQFSPQRLPLGHQPLASPGLWPALVPCPGAAVGPSRPQMLFGRLPPLPAAASNLRGADKHLPGNPPSRVVLRRNWRATDTSPSAHKPPPKVPGTGIRSITT